MSLELSESIRVFVNRRLFGSTYDREAPSYREWTLASFSYAAMLCLAVYCVVGAVLISVGGAKSIPNQVENTYPENNNVYCAIKAVQTGHLYFPPSQPPYVLQPFGPLYYMINAVIAKAVHMDFDLVTVGLRVLTFGCFLASALLIFLICRRLRFPAINSIFAALMFLGQPFFLNWNATARPDMLFLTVMLLSLLLVVQGDTLGTAGYAIAGMLAGLAFLIKQPGLAAPIAVFTILLYRNKFRTAAVFAFSAALPVALVLGILLWHPGAFVEQFTSVGKGLWSFPEGVHFAFDSLLDITVIVPILIGIIGFNQAIRGETAAQMVAVFALTNWIIGFSGLPQLGSDVNYFLPGLAGCALLLPFAVEMVRKNVRLEVTFALISLGLLWATSKELSRDRWVLSSDVVQHRPYGALAPFKILSDRSVFTLHGRDPNLIDPYTAHELELGGHWTSSPIIENVRRGDYDLVILAGTGNARVIGSFRGVAYFSPALVEALNENYTVLCATFSAAALAPRNREVTATPVLIGSVLGDTCRTGSRGRSPDLTIPPEAR